MDLVFTLFQKKMQKTTMKVIGRMVKDQEKENLFGKMDENTRETLKMASTMVWVSSPFQMEASANAIGRVAKNTRVTLKMAFLMD